MKWTSDAEEAVRAYFEERFGGLSPAEIDREEVEGDIRRHVEEELGSQGATVVTVESLRRMLAVLGDLGAGDIGAVDAPGGGGKAVWARGRGDAAGGGAVPPEAPGGAKVSRFAARRSLFLALAVGLPALTVALEVITGFCAGVFFDPVPTWWHVLAVALVPVANLLLFLALAPGRRGGGAADPLFKWAVVMNGFALVVAGYYSLLYAPLVPLAVPALLLGGMGLLPLAVIFAFAGSVSGARRLLALAREAGAGRRGWLNRASLGALAGVLLLAALEGPAVVTRTGLLMATSESPETRDRGLGLLRAAGSERTLLQVCYEGRWATGNAVDTVGWAFLLGRRVPPDQAQALYYRVTGQPFNSVQPPRALLFSKRGAVFDEFEWDEGQGGDAVAGQVSDLDLVSSRVDSHIDAGSSLAYTEWTMVFRNSGESQKEARFQALLPPYGVVSGLSLWIDGEEREAAFSTRQKVKSAYKKVVERRRDPVLVTTTGPDRVLVQCFPVPPSGGEMKIRFGVTCPLDRGVATGRLWLPQMVERNFGVDEALEHAVWVQSKSPLSSPVGSTADDAPESGVYSLRALLPHSDLQRRDSFVDCPEAAAAAGAAGGGRSVWTRDPFAAAAGQGEVLVRTRGEAVAAPVRKLVVVVDGSAAMAPYRDAVAEALGTAAGEVEMTVVLAGDEAEVLGEGAAGAAALGDARLRGGTDNTDGLVEAMALAGSKRDAAVVWLHGPQPVLLASADRLAQFLERTLRPVPLYAVPVVAGPNRVLEALQRHSAVRPGARLGADVAGDLGVFLAQLTAGLVDPEYTWERPAEAPAGDGASEVWDQLARYWAFGEVMAGYFAGGPGAGDGGARADLAARYQLVTPFSGAVVLETVAQFEEAGLKAVDAGTAAAVPVIPEPSAALLLLVAGAGMLLQRRRPCR